MAEPRDGEARDDAERIVVACDTTPLGQAALEAAGALAAAFDTELIGLFIEDVDLVRMAALPFTREFGLESAVPRQVDPEGIERAMRLQAQQTRAALEHIAGVRNLRWEFRVARGQVVRTVLEFARRTDLVVFGKPVHGASVRHVWRTSQTVLQRASARVVSRQPGIVAALFEDSAGARRALAAAYSLCEITGARLTLFVVADDEAQLERLRGEARAWLAERGAKARFIWLANRDPLTVANAVNEESASALLLPDGVAGGDHGVLRALLVALGCPLVLIG